MLQGWNVSFSELGVLRKASAEHARWNAGAVLDVPDPLDFHVRMKFDNSKTGDTFIVGLTKLQRFSNFPSPADTEITKNAGMTFWEPILEPECSLWLQMRGDKKTIHVFKKMFAADRKREEMQYSDETVLEVLYVNGHVTYVFSGVELVTHDIVGGPFYPCVLLFGHKVLLHASVSRKRRRVPEALHARLWKDQSFSDASVSCGARLFPVHCLVLVAASPVFATMFASRMQETATRTLNIVDFSPAAVEAMLEFIYKDALPEGLCSLTYLELFEIANKYEITNLIREMCSRIWHNLTEENVFRWSKAVNRYSKAGNSTAVKLWEAMYNKIRDDDQLLKAFVEQSLE